MIELIAIRKKVLVHKKTECLDNKFTYVGETDYPIYAYVPVTDICKIMENDAVEIIEDGTPLPLMNIHLRGDNCKDYYANANVLFKSNMFDNVDNIFEILRDKNDRV